MKCFYHSADLDGHCSGAIVKYFNPDCKLFGINYGDEFPFSEIEEGETVFMVDFSLQPFGDMVALWGQCDLVWIDHHISAIKESKSESYQMDTAIKGIRIDGIGACSLTWDYCSSHSHKKTINGLNIPEPFAVRLLSEYDVWNHTNTKTLPFQYGMRMKDTIPESNMILWADIFNEFPMDILSDGKTVIEYESQQNVKYCSACAFDTELDGLKCVAINKMLTNSQIFDSVWDNKIYDAMLTFGWRKGSWTVSLYTDKKNIDVSIVAKNRGGGGHKQAAGFQCSELPFKLN